MNRKRYVLIAVALSMGIVGFVQKDEISAALQCSWAVPGGTINFVDSSMYLYAKAVRLENVCSLGSDNTTLADGPAVTRNLAIKFSEYLNGPRKTISAPDQLKLSGHTVYREGTAIRSCRICSKGCMHDPTLFYYCNNEATAKLAMYLIYTDPSAFQ